MKKTLVALAALAVVGAASAQSTVTLFGKVTTGVRSQTQKVDGVKSAAGNVGLQVISSAIGGSRWGMKGSEDLGGGLKANFHLEQGFSSDTGALGSPTAQFSRQAWVGLSGGFGSVSGGSQYAAFDNIIGAFDPSFYYSLGAMAYVVNSGTFGDVSPVINMLKYDSPVMGGGFRAGIQYAPGENKNPAVGQAAGSFLGLQGTYAAGPLGVGFGYEAIKTTTAVPASSTARLWALAASYDLGVAKLSGFYERGSNNTNSATDRGWVFGAVVPVGAMTLNLGYANEKQKDATGAFSGKATAFSAHLTYPLSKRTAIYGEAMSGKKVAFAAGNAVTKNTGVGMGIRHDF